MKTRVELVRLLEALMNLSCKLDKLCQLVDGWGFIDSLNEQFLIFDNQLSLLLPLVF